MAISFIGDAPMEMNIGATRMAISSIIKILVDMKNGLNMMIMEIESILKILLGLNDGLNMMKTEM